MNCAPLLWFGCVCLGAADFDSAPMSPPPVSAHNCYPLKGTVNDKLKLALKLGIPNIEIDLGYDAASGRLLQTHDAAPREPNDHPDFLQEAVPTLEAHLKTVESGGRPLLLTIDWKTDDPQAVKRFRDEFLLKRPDWFTTAEKTREPKKRMPLTERKVTVCFTGSDRAKGIYDDLVRIGEPYQAFRDTVIGSGPEFAKNVASYCPLQATNYHRYVAVNWNVVERGGPTLAGDWTAEDETRLRTLIDRIHQAGFQARFYCLNGGRPGVVGLPYAFKDAEAASLRWKAAARAGADFVATDDYEAIMKALMTSP